MPHPTLRSYLPAVVSVVSGAIALNLTVHSAPAQAFNISYDFTITVPTGTYAGVYKGNFKYDDAGLAGQGSEWVSPRQGNLSVLFNFVHTQFSQIQDRDFQVDFPRVSFQDGKLLGLDFLVIANPLAPNFPGFRIAAQNDPRGVRAGFHVGVSTSVDDNLVGSVVYTLRAGGASSGGASSGSPGDAAGVPEPSEIAGSLIALGLAGLGLKYRRKTRAAS